MAHPVVTYPQPPPTSNTLTSHQRQQLLRSTRKLTKLLGSSPHLIDYDSPSPAVYLDLSNKLISTRSRRSSDAERPPSPTSSVSSVSTTASRTLHKTRLPPRHENHVPQNALDHPFSKKRPPMLRLASPGDAFSLQSIWSSTTLDTVPASPLVARDFDSAQSSPVFDASDDSTDNLLTPVPSPPATPTTPSQSRPYTLHVPHRKAVPALSIDTSEPSFKVTSDATTRRLKMERIRKRLGECVPVDAVFSDESPVDEDGDYVEVTPESAPAQVNVDVRPRWKSSSNVVAFDVIYECPDEHGDEGLANGLSLPPMSSKGPAFSSLRNLNTAFPRQWGKLVKRARREPRF